MPWFHTCTQMNDLNLRYLNWFSVVVNQISLIQIKLGGPHRCSFLFQWWKCSWTRMFSRRILFPLFSLQPVLTTIKDCYKSQIFVLRALWKAVISFSENTLNHTLPLHSITGFLLSSCGGSLGHPRQVFGVFGCWFAIVVGFGGGFS